jgi:type II secretory pathway component PulF
MDQETLNKFEELNKKLDQILRSTEKTRKYILWMLIISLAVVILPLIGLAFVIPQFINIYTNAGLGL